MPRRRAFAGSAAGYALLLPSIVLLLCFTVLPLGALVLLSFWTQQGFTLDTSVSLANYRQLFAIGSQNTSWHGIPFPFENPVPAILLVKSLALAATATVLVLMLAYPMAYFLAFRVTRHKNIWLLLLTIPFFTSFLLRVFAWKVMLGYNGALNSALISLGAIGEPLTFLLYNPVAVLITLTHGWLPFAVLPIYASLQKIDRSLLEAATDLGDGRWRRFTGITLPLSKPGLVGAALLVFIPTVGDYVTPALVGGAGGTMIGNQIQQLFMRQDNAPLAAAISLVMIAATGAIAWLLIALSGTRHNKMMEALR